ncbi:MAG: hypothetical protein QXZ09_01785 [Candidatus Methanomethylicaceae archaeon]
MGGIPEQVKSMEHRARRIEEATEILVPEGDAQRGRRVCGCVHR